LKKLSVGGKGSRGRQSPGLAVTSEVVGNYRGGGTSKRKQKKRIRGQCSNTSHTYSRGGKSKRGKQT